MIRPSRFLAAVLALIAFVVVPLAFAQSPGRPSAALPPPSAPPAATAPPTSVAADEEPTVAPEKKPHRMAESAPDVEADSTDTAEDPSIRYKFVGLRYRGTVIPKFLENLFVNEGATIYSNTIGAELDLRKEGQSIIPWLAYTEYGTGDILFFQKGQPDTSNNYSVVNSSLKGIYAGLDELWSSPLDDHHHFDLEYGFGVGLGFIFGDLQNNWVFRNSAGNLTDSQGRTYTECGSQFDGAGDPNRPCSTAGHQNATTAKVGGYVEPNWFNGGSVPVIFPHLSGTFGVRYKPIKQLETRLDIGIALTGFWFGLSADYGLEKTGKAAEHKASGGPGVRDTL